ncbi:MAG: DNA primase [Emcibacter sp.]|nr:DNA primase [Emcibacter sp.]
MGFTPDFLDEIRSRLAVSDVIGRRVKLIRKGREHSGLCPFHNEKTPSFTVNDDKAFYKCFGCGASGDIFKFVVETEGLNFPEAVERLAGQAGLALPDYTPEDKKRSTLRKSLYDVMEAATKWFEAQLVSQTGLEAMEYLTRRGLSRNTIKKFRLGFSPEGHTSLKEALTSKDGMTEDMLIEAGLLIKLEDEGDGQKPSYDRFRYRLMFPITDRQGRVVAFGGRALNSNAKAKYLNSPETPLFHKGSLLYNLANARKPSFDKGRVIVAEGYMDVIAMAQAGFENAVAPLGTAVTEEQIGELWKLAQEPLMCFDGDKAGALAAHRVAERALPLLKEGYSLRFVHLPTGEDPDSYIRGHGAKAFLDMLEQGQPLMDILWNMKTESVKIDTPEQRAGLELTLSETLLEIRNKNIRGHYDENYQKRLASLFGRTYVADHSLVNSVSERQYKKNHFEYSQKPYGKKNNHRRDETYLGVKDLKNSDIFKGKNLGALKRERLLILTVMNHPWLLKEHHEVFATTDFESAELDKLRNEIIDVSNRESNLERESLYNHLLKIGFGKALEVILKQGDLKAEWFAWPDAARPDVVRGWFHVVNRHRRVSDIQRDIRASEKELAENMTEEVFTRFCALKAELEKAKGDEASIDGYGIASGRDKLS